MFELAKAAQTAAEAARSAGAELLKRLSSHRTIEFKGGVTDLVTDADKAAEKIILALIGERFPDHSILAEERGGVQGTAPYRWIIDPLDGTTNYAHRVPHFCVSIALEHQEQGLVAGAIFDPIRNELFEASRGGGAKLNGEPIRVSTESSLERSLLTTGFPYSIWQKPDVPLKLFDAFIRRSQGMRRAGSAALDLCYVAAGRYDGFFEVSLKAWDVAAGALLVEEAGGRVSNLAGAPLDLQVADILATNGAVHEEMVRIASALL